MPKVLIDKVRATAIMQSIPNSHGWKSCATPDEDAAIKEYWNTLPGSTSYYDAVLRMARGFHLHDLQNRLALAALTGTTITLAPEEADYLAKWAF